MSARVGFSVAVHMKPDILMIDEALSTGDAKFREKANAKMAELRQSARAMFLVSHGLGSIKEMCNEAIWLDHGTLMMRGSPDEVVRVLRHRLLSDDPSFVAEQGTREVEIVEEIPKTASGKLLRRDLIPGA